VKTTIKSLLALALAGFVFTGCAMNHCCKTAQLEYKVESIQNNFESAKLNELGKEGWMLVSVQRYIPDSNNQNLNNFSQYFFKRSKQ
jgi:hypothetical protein